MIEKSVAIIIVNWNNFSDTLGCIESLKKLLYVNYSIYLIDNGSTDESDKKIRNYLKINTAMKIKYIHIQENLGFAAANNIAIKNIFEGDQDYIWLLNNDTEVTELALSELVNTISKENSIGIIGSKIYYYGTKRIWSAGGKVDTWKGTTHHIGLNVDEETRRVFSAPFYVDYVTGCSMLIRKNVIDEIGLLSEKYFMYFEETEFNLRAANKGWKIVCEPKSIIYHKVSVSLGVGKEASPKVAYYYIRNGYMMIKNTQRWYKCYSSYVFKYYKAVFFLMKIFIKNQNMKISRIMYIFKAL